MREKQANGSDIDSAMSVILMSPPPFFLFTSPQTYFAFWCPGWNLKPIRIIRTPRQRENKKSPSYNNHLTIYIFNAHTPIGVWFFFATEKGSKCIGSNVTWISHSVSTELLRSLFCPYVKTLLYYSFSLFCVSGTSTTHSF